MKKLRQFEVLILEDLLKHEFHQPTHKQNYYEIVYIFEGSGSHYLNGTATNYEAGDLFFISPEDAHYLEIKELTHFGVIKFTDSYFDDILRSTPNSLLRTRPDITMMNKAFKEIKLTLDALSKALVKATVQNILDCKNKKDLDRSPFVFFQILSLFGIFQEWDVPDSGYSWKPDKEILISYIHQHIYDPEKIQIKNLAQTFNISENYFSVYFKNNFGIGHRQYVNNYRIKLIEGRIKAGFSLRQIADEFGFADESHLSNFFKKHHSVSFRQYRAALNS